MTHNRARLLTELLVTLLMSSCADVPATHCPDLTGVYGARANSGLNLGAVLGLGSASSVALVSGRDELLVSSGKSRRKLARGADFECTSAGLALTMPTIGGYEVPGVISEHVNRYYTLSKAADGALIARTTDRERVKFIGPELSTRGNDGPAFRWPAQNTH